MNNARNQSIVLMQLLQPFTQMGYVRAERAAKIIKDYQKGDTTALKAFLNDASLPVAMQSQLDEIAQLV